jgi:hypothetical protein
MSARIIGVGVLAVLALVFVAFKTRTPMVVSAAEEQALIIKVPLDGTGSGNGDEIERLHGLEDKLTVAVKESGAGGVDGDEVGEGTFTIYIYGPSAEKLFAVSLPILRKFRPPTGSYVIKRYGKPGAKQDRIPVDSSDTPTK